MWLRLEVPIEEFDRDEWEHSDNVVEGKCVDGVQVMFERVDAVIGDTLTFQRRHRPARRPDRTMDACANVRVVVTLG